jgi:hypothetical protein
MILIMFLLEIVIVVVLFLFQQGKKYPLFYFSRTA